MDGVHFGHMSHGWIAHGAQKLRGLMTIFRVALMGLGAGFLPHLERESLGGEPHPLTYLIGQEIWQVSGSMREATLGPRSYGGRG